MRGCLLASTLAIVAGQPLFATIDGSNRAAEAQKRTWNAAGSTFMPTRTYYADGVSAVNTSTLARARLISNTVFRSGPFKFNAGGISHMSAIWGQWVAHDVTKTLPVSDPASPEMLTIDVPRCDSDMDRACNGSRVLMFGRNVADPASGTSSANPRRQLNGQTGWLDASTVYGSTSARSALVRAFYGGLLLEDPVNGLPRNTNCVSMAGSTDPCKQRLAGDIRANVFPGLLSLHGLFVKEHNRIARKLAETNPSWGDERLFQEARKRVMAINQAITYNEYIPALLNEALPPYAGYNASVDPRIDPRFAIAAYRYGHSGINSVLFCIKPNGYACPTGHLLLRESFFSAAFLDWGVTIGDIMRGAVAQPESAIDTAMVPDVRNRVEGVPQDLAVLDIARGRDFGLPTYSQARAELGLPPAFTWDDVTTDPRVQQALSLAYNGRIQDVDLWVGGLAEYEDGGHMVGPVFRMIILEQFRRLRDGDRFWYENTALVDGSGARYLSDAEIAEIRSTRLADVLARNTDWASPPRNVFRSTNIIAPGMQPAATPSPSPTRGASAASPSPASGGGGGAPAKRTLSIATGFSMEWTPPAAGETSITLTFKLTGTGWFGIGLDSASMVGADIWMMRYVNGRGEVVDAKAASYAMPATDSSQDVTVVSSSQTGGVTTITVRRALNTGDGNDAVIRSGAMPVVFAWDPSSTTYGYHAGNRASLTVTFL